MTPYHFYTFSLRALSAFSGTFSEACKSSLNIKQYKSGKGFTLLETMIAVSLLAIAIVAPMTLTAQSLASAYYARDQITAFYLAQEALEAVRNVRDNNILENSQGNSVPIFNPSWANGTSFRIDTRDNSITLCSNDPGSTCIPLQTDGTIYGYSSGWTTTQFTRTVAACFIQSTGACTGAESDEVKVTVSVSWQSGGLQRRTVRVSENLYRWVSDGSAAI